MESLWREESAERWDGAEALRADAGDRDGRARKEGFEVKAARELLKALTAEVPPRPGCHHCLTLSDGGELVVTMTPTEGECPFPVWILDDTDLERPIGELAAELVRLVRAEFLKDQAEH
jgi:hypothetical protein